MNKYDITVNIYKVFGNLGETIIPDYVTLTEEAAEELETEMLKIIPNFYLEKRDISKFHEHIRVLENDTTLNPKYRLKTKKSICDAKAALRCYTKNKQTKLL